METLRSAVMTACAAGIVSVMISSLSPDGGNKTILRVMISMTVLICLAKPLAGINADDAVRTLEEITESLHQNDNSAELDEYDLKAAELSLKLELEKLLEDNGISFSETVIKCSRDEYDVISISKAEITVPDVKNADKLKSFADSELTDIPLTVKVAGRNEG